MSYHQMEIVSDGGEAPRLRITCAAPPDAPCRKRPTAARECWDWDDPDLEPGHECLWVEWVQYGGWESLQMEATGVIASIPVHIECIYDEGPSLLVLGTVADAELDAACDAYLSGPESLSTWDDLKETSPEAADEHREGMRAALEAARAVSGR